MVGWDNIKNDMFIEVSSDIVMNNAQGIVQLKR